MNESISMTPPARDAGVVMPGVNSVSGFPGQDPMKYSLADLTIDTGRQLVSRAASPIPLPKLSYDLLLALVRAAPNLVSLDELMRLVWSGIIVSPETVSQRIKLLRDALEDDPRLPRYVAGLRGRGYRIVPSVREIPDPSAPAPPTAVSTGSDVLPPFEHSEDRKDQALAQTMIRQLGNDKWTRYAAAHMRIIERFGRFPHRNELLKRPSTAEELAFLKNPANLF